MSSPIIVIATYNVPPQNQKRYFEVMRRRRNYFLAAYYVTSRKPIVMRSRKDPAIIVEVFEWTGEEAIEKAHKDPKVIDGYWKKMEALWEEGGFGLEKLPEAGDPFAGFDPVEVY